MPIRRGAIGRLITSLRLAKAQRPKAQRTRWGLVSALLVSLLVALSIVVVRAQPPSATTVLAAGSTDSNSDFGGALDVNGNPLPTADPNAGVDDNQVSADAAGGLGTDPGATTPASDPSTSAAAADTSVPDTTAAPTTIPSPPTTNPHGPVRLVGDSVMLGASSTLKSVLGPSSAVDAVVGRQVSVGVQIFQKWEQLGQIPDVIVVQLGNNGTFTDQQFDQIMQSLKTVRKVIFVNVKVPRRWEDTNNQVIENGVSRYSNTVLVDWFDASNDHPEYFWSDGMHLRPEGAQIYANLIASKL
jgi:hypothetical protein